MFDRSTKAELPVVLLIDDDLVSREVTATLLTMSGYMVHTVVNGTASLEFLDKGACRPGVILMDAQMPGLSGAELIAELRGRTDARIYGISGSQPPPEVAEAADGFLLKPFDVEALRKILNGRKPGGTPSMLDLNEPVISNETLGQLRKLMPEPAVREIYAAVVSDLTSRIGALSAAIDKGDFAEVRRIGHAIKGGCGMAGAMQAAHVGALIENTPVETEDNHLDNTAALLRDLQDAAQGLERMLDSELPA